jgi:hypothetical protein
VAWSGSISARVAGALAMTALGFAHPIAGVGEMAVATPDNPAVITAVPPPGPARAQAGRSTYVELSVLAFKPPEKGSVQAVVKLHKDASNAAQELGRFGLFPNAEFKAQNLSEAQRFIFRLPEGKLPASASAGIRLSVDLVPYGGTGEGARLELGGAEIQRR